MLFTEMRSLYVTLVCTLLTVPNFLFAGSHEAQPNTDGQRATAGTFYEQVYKAVSEAHYKNSWSIDEARADKSSLQTWNAFKRNVDKQSKVVANYIVNQKENAAFFSAFKNGLKLFTTSEEAGGISLVWDYALRRSLILATKSNSNDLQDQYRTTFKKTLASTKSWQKALNEADRVTGLSNFIEESAKILPYIID